MCFDLKSASRPPSTVYCVYHPSELVDPKTFERRSNSSFSFTPYSTPLHRPSSGNDEHRRWMAQYDRCHNPLDREVQGRSPCLHSTRSTLAPRISIIDIMIHPNTSGPIKPSSPAPKSSNQRAHLRKQVRSFPMLKTKPPPEKQQV